MVLNSFFTRFSGENRKPRCLKPCHFWSKSGQKLVTFCSFPCIFCTRRLQAHLVARRWSLGAREKHQIPRTKSQRKFQVPNNHKEIPNNKFQITNKFQAPNHKEIPNNKFQITNRFQAPNSKPSSAKGYGGQARATREQGSR